MGEVVKRKNVRSQTFEFQDSSPTRGMSTMGNIETPFCPSDVYKVTPDFSNC